jgi:manganese/zinc/iron transport system permease protein
MADLFELLTGPALRTVALGSTVLGVVSGALGSFAVLRRQSLVGDAISHAALPGIAIAFLLTRSKSVLVLVAGAAAAGWLATTVVRRVTRATRVPFDSALAGVLAVFFGFGLLLLTHIQRTGGGDASQAGLDRFLFGQAATLLEADVWAMAALGAVLLTVLAMFWKEFKLLCFDPDFAASLGYPVRGLDAGLTALLVLAIVAGLQGVGVVLMSAMLVAPAVAARPWCHRLGPMVLMAAAAGGLSGLAGTVLGHVLDIPTGPTIVLCAVGLVAVSLSTSGLVESVRRRPAPDPEPAP